MSRLLAPFDYYEVKDPGQADALDLLPVVEGLPGVEMAELDWLKLETYLLVPTDTFWASQWNMAQIGTVNAWDVSTGSPSVWLAIIDSGFDLTHPDLSFTPNSGGTLTHYNADQAITSPPRAALVDARSYPCGSAPCPRRLRWPPGSAGRPPTERGWPVSA